MKRILLGALVAFAVSIGMAGTALASGPCEGIEHPREATCKLAEEQGISYTLAAHDEEVITLAESEAYKHTFPHWEGWYHPTVVQFWEDTFQGGGMGYNYYWMEANYPEDRFEWCSGEYHEPCEWASNSGGIYFNYQLGVYITPIPLGESTKAVDTIVQYLNLKGDTAYSYVEHSLQKLRETKDVIDTLNFQYLKNGSLKTSVNARTNKMRMEVTSALISIGTPEELLTVISQPLSLSPSGP